MTTTTEHNNRIDAIGRRIDAERGLTPDYWDRRNAAEAEATRNGHNSYDDLR